MLAGVCLMAGGLCEAVLAQVEIPPPQDPVLRRAPKVAEWTITFRYKRDKSGEALFQDGAPAENDDSDPEDSEGLPPLLKRIVISRDGKFLREVKYFTGGKRSEKWIAEGYQLQEIANFSDLIRVSNGGDYDPYFSDFRRSDFEELEWVGKENYRGVKTLGGVAVYAFSTEESRKKLTPREQYQRQNPENDVASGGPDRPVSSPQTDPIHVAYIDARTRLPVYYDDGKCIRLYKFNSSPPMTLNPAEKFRRGFDTWRQERASTRSLPSPP